LFILAIILGTWLFLRNLSVSVIYQQVSTLVIIAVGWALSVFFIYRIFISWIYKPVKKIEKISGLISVGDLSEKANLRGSDELGRIAGSMDRIIQNQSNLCEFLEKIGDGNFNIDYTVLSDKDKLGYSITGMRDKLQKLVSEDASRQWSSEGIARFGAILREYSDDLNMLFDKLLCD
jgi:methyl-accepting chemotaxis protein